MIGATSEGENNGFSIIEAVFAILLGALLISAAWMGLARQRSALENMMRRAEGLATIRMVRTALVRDRSSAGREGLAVGADTLGLRAVRGIAARCVSSGREPMRGESYVQYRGIRLPDPSKDSIRGLTSSGEWLVADLVDVSPLTECDRSDGRRGLALISSGDLEGLVYAEVFEVGSYHLAGRALRYRRSGGSRQPLTPENVGLESRFSSTGLGLEVVLTSDDVDPWFISLGPARSR
jgi:hypothetical protein